MGGNGTPQAAQPTSGYANTGYDGSPSMSYPNGTTNAMPIAQPMAAQQQYAQQASSMPTATSADPNDPIAQAKQDAMAQIAKMQIYKQSGLFDTPYEKAMKNHPILMGLANAAQSFGQGITKQPFYTDNQSNQAALQGKQMDNLSTLASPANAMNMLMMRQMADQMKNSQPQVNNGKPAIGSGSRVPSPQDAMAAKQKGATHYDDSTGQWLMPVK